MKSTDYMDGYRIAKFHVTYILVDFILERAHTGKEIRILDLVELVRRIRRLDELEEAFKTDTEQGPSST